MGMYSITALWLATSLLLQAQTPSPLTRSSTVPTLACDRSQFATTTPLTDQLVNQLAQRIFAANTQTFRGDLAPQNICHGIQIEGVRAFANSQTRSFAIEGGLIRRAQNVNQLAWVISHELAHITMRHGMDGSPIPPGQDRNHNHLDDAAEVRGLMARHAAMINQINAVAKTGKGSPASNRMIAEAEVLNSRINSLMGLHMTPEELANWMENEADEIAVRIYTQSGFDPAEIGWRQEQEAIARHAGLDPHSPPQHPDAASRSRAAKAACGFTQDLSLVAAPERGTHRYPQPCWSIWNFNRQIRQYSEPLRGPRVATGNTALVNAQNEIAAQQMPSLESERPVALPIPTTAQ